MSEEKAEEAKTNGPATFKRDEKGLIVGVDYIYKDDGTIDWRKMVPREHITPFKEKTNETDIDKCSDKELLILLNGFKAVAKLRGFSNISHVVTSPHPDAISATCSITWIPNFETEDREVTVSGCADATRPRPDRGQDGYKFANTSFFGGNFLTCVAENRAFVRAVRNFLDIEIYGFDELDADKNVIPTSSSEDSYDVADSTEPLKLLKAAMDDKRVSVDMIRHKLAAENYPGADTVELADLPEFKIIEFTGRIRKVPNNPVPE